jgi:hypothetical protein
MGCSTTPYQEEIPMNVTELKKIAALIRYYILVMTTQAGSGHPTSSLSAADLMTCLLFGGIFKFDGDLCRRGEYAFWPARCYPSTGSGFSAI